ncbi:MAG: carbon-nitrogen hydrolase family protein [Campylobacterota bacterium]
MKLVSLQMKTGDNFDKNLAKLKELISSCEDNSLILAPEVCLSGFCYEKMDEASKFSIKAIEQIKDLAINKTIALTFITKKNGKYYNSLHIFHKQKSIHQQDKYKLFALGAEPEHFACGNKEDIKIIDIDGIKVATLICFELRFPILWEKVKGADIILNPSMWGVKRKDHFESISKALALVNQCFVIATNSANDNMAKGSAIISPFGDTLRDDTKEKLELDANLDEVQKVRKYIDIGLNQ